MTPFSPVFARRTPLSITISAIVTSAMLPTLATAADTLDASLPSTTVDPIVVTATRTPTLVSDTIAQTRVVDQQELQRFQGQTVFDVLKQQPGFSAFQNGGMGTAGNFYVRGYDSKQVLVLIDGVRYGSISSGQAAVNLLPADQIERIEILYGASGSSIYGADAMGGVIQIFTKGSDINSSNASVTAGIGSHNQRLYAANLQYHNNQGTNISLSASRNKTDGINATLPDNLYGYKDKDGFDSKNYSLALNQQINGQLSAGIAGMYSDSTTDFDNGNNNKPAYADQKNGAAQAHVTWQYQPNSSIKLQYGQSIDKSNSYSYDSYKKINQKSTFDTTQKQASIVGTHGTDYGQVIYGAEHLEQTLETTAYTPKDRKVTSGFLGYLLANNTADAQANVRYDDNSQYGSQTSYNVGAAYHITPNLRFGGNYAKGFRAPNFNELYYTGSGNPDLKPESSNNYEAFTEFSSPLQTTRLTAYRNNVENLVTYVYQPTTANPWAGTNQNVNKANIKGISLTSDWYLDDYLFGLSYDYQQAKDASGGKTDGNFLPIRPEHKGLVYVGYQLPEANIRAEYQYVGDYYSNAGNLDSQKVDHYGLLNISGNYQLTPNLSMTARLNNVTNKKYITLPGYNTDGTNFMTSLTYTWF
ncbi:TonB-dependent receptor plug domain-containing protein [Psychrobacter sp. I-STPA10]|uniref:TonB-dependent receptor plug domain-containing protein n=1 Tax=Psychrobacter sp. I-STPA10 TaxID=2585769 RepID=UPI001E52B661|nr:TonB-dependent receptor [Psychrobacter sp. I-STPA10]